MPYKEKNTKVMYTVDYGLSTQIEPDQKVSAYLVRVVRTF